MCVGKQEEEYSKCAHQTLHGDRRLSFIADGYAVRHSPSVNVQLPKQSFFSADHVEPGTYGRG